MCLDDQAGPRRSQGWDELCFAGAILHEGIQVDNLTPLDGARTDILNVSRWMRGGCARGVYHLGVNKDAHIRSVQKDK